MRCQTAKPNVECVFMKKSGCSYNGGQCHTTVEQCEGCQRVVEFPTGNYCMSFTEPELKWASGTCPLATHVKRDVQASNRRLNPLKASKRAMNGRT